MEYDFCGWATRNNIRCSDGRTIMKDAFLDNDGGVVPLVWNHQHNDPDNVLGHAVLENRNEGVYAYCSFNDSEHGKNAKTLVEHGDVSALSIYANQLKQNGGNVMHGVIREVSLVLAGANPGAFIESVIRHGEMCEEEAIIYTGEDILMSHSDIDEGEIKMEDNNEVMYHNDTDLDLEHADNGETVEEVFNTLNEKQKTVVAALIGMAAKNGFKEDDDEEDANMKHNIFENDYEDTLQHSEVLGNIIDDAKRYGSLKESALAHGIDQIEYLFPDAKNLNTPPEFIKRDTDWVSIVMNGVHHTPFSRIKSTFADITEDDARAKGYLPDHTHRDAKGNLVGPDGNPAYKKEEVFSLLKRTTTPTTVYKKQKLDRDDVVDITDFDVISWLKTEMRMMLDEELARAYLIGDGRLSSSDEKINPNNIRPIAFDDDFYTIKKQLAYPSGASDNDKAKLFIKTAVKARIGYKGSGTPTLFTTEEMLTELLLIEDNNGVRMYKSESELASAMRVAKIVVVPVMENVKGPKGGDMLGVIVNLNDYNVGADKGGAINMFDDFDIDYNAQKYLIETRCSGALIKPYSAIVIETTEAAG